MSTNVGFATLSVIPSMRGFQSKLEAGANPALTAAGSRGGLRFGDAAGKSAGARFGRVFAATARTALIGGAGVAALAVKVGSDSIGLASDLAESQNKVNVVFGSSAKIIQRFGRTSAKAIGLSRQKALEAAGTYGNLFVNLGVGEKASAKMSKRMVKLASDLASFNNIAPEDALERLRSGLLGEQEAVERLGISITEQGLKQRAFDLGLTDTTKGVLPPAIRTQAAYAEIVAQTGLAQGDFARTQDNLANKQRILSARWDDARAKLGTALLPMMQDLVGFVTDKGIPAFEDFSDWFTKKGIPAIKDLAKKMRPLADELLPAARDGFKGIKNFAEKALPFATGIVGAFNDMPGWVKKILIAGTAGGLTAKKLGLGKSITANLFSKGGSPANPLYVFTVNGGGGPKVPAIVPKVGNLPKWAPFIPVGLGSAPGQDSLMKQLTGVGMEGDKSKQLALPKKVAGNWDKARGAASDYFVTLQNEGTPAWDKVRGKAADYFTLLHRNERTTLRTTVTGWPTATREAREYLEVLLQIRGTHIDNRLDRAGGSGSRPGSGIVPRATGGIVIANQTVIAHDYKDFVQQSNRRNISAAANGMPPT